ncbi:hypothetical protein BGZ95_006697, partial [Linnemannia exigua]
SVSFMKHATVTTVNDDDHPSNASSNNNSNSDNNTIMVPTGAPGNVHRSSFRPGRRPGYVRKGPVQSDSEDDDEEEEETKEEENESEEEENGDEKVNAGNGIGSFSSEWEQAMASFTTATPDAGTTTATATATASTTTSLAAAVRPGPGKNYVRRAPVNSDTESDEEKMDDAEPRRSSPTSTTRVPTALHINKKKGDEEESSDTDDEGKNGTGMGGLVRPMAQAKISGPGQNYVRKAPVTSDTEDDEDSDNKPKQPLSKSVHAAAPAVNSPAPQPPHSAGSIHNRHLNTALGATTPASGSGSGPHSRASSHDPYFAGGGGVVAGVGGMSSALSSPRSAPVATSPAYNPYTPPSTAASMTLNSNASNSSLGNLSNLSNSNNGSNPHLASVSSQVAAASLANSMAIYQQQQQEMMMIMQQQQLQIATMQQQQQAYQLLVYQQQQQHQQQLHAVQQQHSRAASASGSVHTLEGKVMGGASDSDDDVPLGEKQNQLPQLPALPQFSSILGGSSSPPPSHTTITPASPTAVHYSPRLSVQPSPLLNNHNRQVSSSSIHSLSSGGGAGAVAYLHQPISSSPLNPATSNAALLGQHQVYSGAHTHQQTSSQPRLSDFIEEEQDRLLREQHLQATAAALGGHTVNATSYNNGASLLTSSFPAGYRGSVASVMSLQQQSSGIDRGSMNSLHSAGSSGSSGSNSGGNVNGNGGGGLHRPTPSRDSFIPQMATTLIQQQQYLTQHPHLLHQQPPQQYSPYQQLQQQHQPSTLIHVEAKPPPPSAGLVGAISAMERDKKLAKAHGTNQLQFQHQQAQQQMMMNAEKERWLQEQRRLAWEAGQFPQQQVQQQQHPIYYQQQGMGQPGMMMMMQ